MWSVSLLRSDDEAPAIARQIAPNRSAENDRSFIYEIVDNTRADDNDDAED